MRLMRLYSYVLTHDTGFAPNPFRGYCTLANCKPVIRRTAQVGDWIVGLSPKASGNKIIYAMKIDEILSYEQYFTDNRFQPKKPNDRETVHKCGDNIYQLANGEFYQLPGSMHKPKDMEHDLKGKRVLVSSQEFAYFGQKAVERPPELDCLVVGRAHRCRFSQEQIRYFLDFISDHPRGVFAPPTKWPKNDESWRS